MNTTVLEKTLCTYIAKPEDSRCAWWAICLGDDLAPQHLTEKYKTDFLKRNGDYELPVGTLILTSEEMHHRHSRGYVVGLRMIVGDNKTKSFIPTIACKRFIKEEGHLDLMSGTGDIAAVLRCALWIKRQPNAEAAFNTLYDLA